MSSIYEYLKLKDSQIYEKNSLIISIAKQIFEKKLTVESVFKSLHLYFVNENEENRIKACKLIKNIFSKKNIFIEEQEFVAIYAFFLEKIKDIIIIEHVVSIILILLEKINNNNANLFIGQSQKFLSVFYNNLIFFLPAYNQKIRNTVLKIINLILPVLCENSHEFFDQETFLGNFLNQIEGEKDPRNLLILLEIFKKIFDLFEKKYFESKKCDIFDILECYYPISFNKSGKNLSFKIEKEDLEYELNSCLFHDILFKNSWDLAVDKIRSGILESQIAGINSINYVLQNSHYNLDEKKILKIWELLRNLYSELEEDDILKVLSISICSYIGFLLRDYHEKSILSNTHYELLITIFGFIFDEIKENPKDKPANLGFEIIIKLWKNQDCDIIRDIVNDLFFDLISYKFTSNDCEIVLQNYFLFLNNICNVCEIALTPKMMELLIIGVKNCKNEKNSILCMKILSFFKEEAKNFLNELIVYQKSLTKESSEIYKRCAQEFIYELQDTNELAKQWESSFNYEILEILMKLTKKSNHHILFEKFIRYLLSYKKFGKNEANNIKKILSLFRNTLFEYNNIENNDFVKGLFANFKIVCEIFIKDSAFPSWFIYYLLIFMNNNEFLNQNLNVYIDICQRMVNIYENICLSTNSNKIKKIILCTITNLNFLFDNFSIEKLKINNNILFLTIQIFLFHQTKDLKKTFFSKLSEYDPLKFLKEIYSLSKKPYLEINPMFQQSLFEIIYESYSKSTSSPKNRQIITFLFLNSPFILIKPYMNEALSIIINTISENISDLSIALDLLQQIMDSNTNLQFSDGFQLEKIIKSLLHLLTIEIKPWTEKKKIIYCIERCSRFDENASLKYIVISGLKAMLDHPKRIIRKEAAQALNTWNSFQ